MLGLLLGVAWSPCVGPTLGVAIGLASQGKQLFQVALVMLLFGLGAALPIIGLGMLSRQGMKSFRGKLQLLGGMGKQLLGILMLALGVMMLTGMDKLIEAGLPKNYSLCKANHFINIRIDFTYQFPKDTSIFEVINSSETDKIVINNFVGITIV